MSISYRYKQWRITLAKRGEDRYTKVSYPLRYGRYTEVMGDNALYHFNLNGEISHARGRGGNWSDPQEWLKRSAGNDWVYYSTGGYSGVFAAIGEYYLPNLQYSTNSLLGGNPFAGTQVRRIINTWHQDIWELSNSLDKEKDGRLPPPVREFLARAAAYSPAVLAARARRLFAIGGGRVTVLPPDTRHVDYDVLPLTIASGCLYKCRFCRVKNTHSFREMGRNDIVRQLGELAEHFGANLRNYNSIFLGEHDALCCSTDLLLFSITTACEKLGLAESYMRGANVFFFGSVDSFLMAEERLFEELSRLPLQVYINLGLESFDQQTLDQLGKPVSAARVAEAFARMQEVNGGYMNIELSANFLMDPSLSPLHHENLLIMIRDSIKAKKPKGAIYLSPLRFGAPSRELVFAFNRLKMQSRLPTFLYIIQRL